MNKKSNNSYATVYHRDGTVTVWDIYKQRWIRHTRSSSDAIFASLSADERSKILNHISD